MSKAAHIEIQNKTYELFNQGRVDDVLRQAADDVQVEMIPFGLVHRGHGGFRDFLTGFLGAFPDLRIEVKRQVADDARVAVELTAHGTHRGPLMTPAGALAPTGKSVTFTVCEVWDFRDGKIAGIRNYQDAASILRQIGAA